MEAEASLISMGNLTPIHSVSVPRSKKPSHIVTLKKSLVLFIINHFLLQKYEYGKKTKKTLKQFQDEGNCSSFYFLLIFFTEHCVVPQTI